MYELDVALDVAEQRGMDDNAFVIVEFSQRAYDEYRRRIRDWDMKEIQSLGLGLDRKEWEQQRKQPEYAYYRMKIDCEQAECSQPEDAVWIRSRIEANAGGWERLNERMASFRRPPAASTSSHAAEHRPPLDVSQLMDKDNEQSQSRASRTAQRRQLSQRSRELRRKEGK